MKLPDTLPKREIEQGSAVFRVFVESLDADGNRLYEATDFNPYFGITTQGDKLVTIDGKCAHLKKRTHRFSPTIENGQTVPAIYAGSSDSVAFSEAIFRSHDKRKPITMSDIEGKFLSEVFVQKKLVLCDLATPYLKGGALEQFDFTPDESIYSLQSAKAYKRCHEIANAIYQHSDTVDGVYWESRHLPNTFNIVLWQRDINSKALTHFQRVQEVALFDGMGKQKVLLEACRLGVPASELM